MSDKYLKSLTFPDLADRYVVGDSSLSVSGAAADAKTTGDALATKAEVDGAYEGMTVGNAEQLVGTTFEEDSVPYNFRTSGGSIDIGDREYDELVGGTVAWNQLIPIGTDKSKTQNGVTFTDNRDGSYTIQTTAEGASADAYLTIASETTSRGGHVTLLVGAPAGSSYEGYRLWDAWGGAGNEYGNGSTGKFVAGGQFEIRISVGSGTIITTPVKFTPQLFDITQMFGSAIANYFYDTLRLTSGASKAWFRKFFSKPIYAYNAGELMSVQASSHDTVGFNQLSDAFELSKVWNDNGVFVNGSQYYTASPQKIRVIPNTTYCIAMPNISVAQGFVYYKEFDANGDFIRSITTTNALPLDRKYTTFTVSADAYYIGVFFYRSAQWTSSEVADVCINLHWDGERDGDYEAYKKWTYPLDSDLELRGIPRLDASNNLYYDGDEYESDGTVTRKYTTVDLGTLTWGYTAGVFYAVKSDMLFMDGYSLGVCSKYAVDDAQYTDMTDKTLSTNMKGFSSTPNILVKDTAYSDAASFKTAMSGVYLIYELATPTTEEAEPYQNTQIVDDFGTEEFVDTRDVAIPVGHNTKYQSNLRAKLEMLPNSPDGDGDYLMRQTNGENSFVPFVKELPALPSEDGTYVLKCTVSGSTKTLGWVEEE